MNNDSKLAREIERLSAVVSLLNRQAAKPTENFSAKVQDVLDALRFTELEHKSYDYFDPAHVLSHLSGSEFLSDEEFHARVPEIMFALDLMLAHGLVYAEHLDSEPYYRTTRDAKAYFDYTKVSN